MNFNFVIWSDVCFSLLSVKEMVWPSSELPHCRTTVCLQMLAVLQIKKGKKVKVSHSLLAVGGSGG